ncbi:SusC/RagA family TonB-linked outer membrane protein [Marinilabiliaceae bacterium JC017]|nr:SusC/RagA family TonB-linked outer membrane protein [Marinilabiliaceae bacterium JC017]
MKKNRLDSSFPGRRGKIWLIMRLTFFLIMVCLSNIGAVNSLAQKSKFTINVKNATIKEVLDEIENESDFYFYYKSDELISNHKVSGNFQELSILELLDQVLDGSNLSFRIVDNYIAILPVVEDTTNVNTQEQVTTIKGKVTDKTGEAIPGVSILVKGTMEGTITDIDGNYSLKVSSGNDVLVFSFIGMEAQEIAVGEKTKIDVVLFEEVLGLDEVVVVGYGSQTRSKMTSSIATVKTDDLKQASVANLENALGGRMSGVFARQVSGEPGYDGADIRIRGFGSALIVVDGVPGRSYSNLDPNEIESISVLKDAASAAVYGMQGANGVILVTTKKGSSEKPTIEVNSFYGVQNPTRFPEPMGSNDWQRMQNTFRANNQIKNDPNAVILEDDMKIDNTLPNTNWANEGIRDYAPLAQTNVNIIGGNDNVKYFFSLGHLKQEGIWTANSISKERYNVRSNLDIKINDNLKVQGGIGGIFNQLQFPGAGQHDIGDHIIRVAPIFNSVNPMGYTYIPQKGVYNPLALMDKNVSGYTNDKIKEWNINLSAEYKVPFLEGLSVKGVLGYDTYDQQKKDWSKKIVFYNEVNGSFEPVVSKDGYNKTKLGLNDSSNYDLTIQGFLKYIKSIERNNFNLSLIYEQTKGNGHGFGTGRDTYPSDVVDNIGAGMDDDKKWNNEWERTYASQSYIGRLSYDFDTRYLIEFVGRYDGSQYFAPDNRWGFFPAVSAGWMISKEGFMEPLKGLVSELKLRASWGQLGDMSAAQGYYSKHEDYYWKEGYRYPGDVLQLGNDKIYTLGERLNPNPDFTWSKSTTYNLGLDGKLWGSKLGFSAEVFYRERTDLPAKKADDNSGNLATYYNLNGDNTRGFELSLDHHNNINELKYTISANLSWARTQYGHIEQKPFTSGYNKWRYGYEGNWNNSSWGYGVEGRYQNEKEIVNGQYLVGYSKGDQFPGDVIYDDWNGDGYIDSKDQHVIGRSSYPEMIYGMTIGLDWKGIDFMMFWQGAEKSQYFLDGRSINPFNMDNPDQGTFGYLSSYWHKANYTEGGSEWVSGEYPTYRNGYGDVNAYGGANTFWQRSGSYLRLKNIELGYTLPKFLTEKVKIKSARVYVNCYNLLTFNSFKYIDPETGGGQKISDYPQIKSFNVGVNLKF